VNLNEVFNFPATWYKNGNLALEELGVVEYMCSNVEIMPGV